MMKKLFNCEMNYFPNEHLAQIYAGFEKLRKLGIIDVTYKSTEEKILSPLLRVKINNKYNVIYDTLDGFNWINGSINANLNYFKNNIKADFYFKRSFTNQIFEYAPHNCRVFPLGLNYYINNEMHQPKKHRSVKNLIKNSVLFKLLTKQQHNICQSNLFEFRPIPNKINKILFYTRLWNPESVMCERLRTEREQINKIRTNTIRICQKEFGTLFSGGIYKDGFSINHCPDLIVSQSSTNKANYLETVKKSNICIGTSGLHDSVGWKFGEYVAASRAIVSEPLKYELPGEFKENKNYSIFTNEDDLLNKIYFLLENKDFQFEMMNNNFQYYNNYLKPEILILNTLLKIYNDIE